MSEDKEMFDTADEIYFDEMETAGGLELELEEDVRNRFVGLVEDRMCCCRTGTETLTKSDG